MKKQILLVDDDSKMLELLQIALSDDGHTVEVALSGEAGIRLIDQRRFDLIVTDFNMPGMKGDEFAVLSKGRWPQTPVVMFTGLAEALHSSRRSISGVDLLLDKATNIFEFCSIVTQLLRNQANMRSGQP